MVADEFIPFSSWIIYWTSAGVNCQKYIRGNIVSTKSCWGNMNHYWCKQDIFNSWYSLDASQYGSDLEWSVLSCLPFKQFWISNFYFASLSLSWRRHSGILFFHYIFFRGLSPSSFLVRNNRLNIFIQLCVLGN